jgi:hypothetical protein
MISEHLTSWLGFPVHPLGFEELKGDIPDLSRTVCRLYIGWESEGTFSELFARFLALKNVDRTPAIIIGAYSGDDSSLESREAVELLVKAQAKLPGLRGIFLGDIISEENEISWITQSDVSPLLTAYPRLEHLAVRGGNGLVLGRLDHPYLKSLVIQSGGLPRSVLADLAQSTLPTLDHLELWLGSDNYGWDGTVADLLPLADGRHFPQLRTLALCNSEIQDDVAAAISGTPIVARLDTLAFSLGNLSDTGGEALLRHPGLSRLKKLDLHYHYLSPEMEKRLKQAFPRVDVSERQEADEYGDEVHRSISASE